MKPFHHLTHSLACAAFALVASLILSACGGGGGGGSAVTPTNAPPQTQQFQYIHTQDLTLTLTVDSSGNAQVQAFQGRNLGSNLYEVVIPASLFNTVTLTLTLTENQQGVQVATSLPLRALLANNTITLEDSGGTPVQTLALAERELQTTISIAIMVNFQTIAATTEIPPGGSDAVTLTNSTATVTATTTTDVTITNNTVTMSVSETDLPAGGNVVHRETDESKRQTITNHARTFVSSLVVVTTTPAPGTTDDATYQYLTPHGEWAPAPDWMLAQANLLQFNLPSRTINGTNIVITNYILTVQATVTSGITAMVQNTVATATLTNYVVTLTAIPPPLITLNPNPVPTASITATLMTAATLYVDSTNTPLSVILPPPSTPDDIDYDTAEYRYDHGLGDIRAAVAYNHGYFGQGVTIAIVDSGVLTSHVDLSANIVPGARIPAANNVQTDIGDGSGHGTGVAGVAAAVMDGSGRHGVAPQAKIMPIQLGNSSGDLIAGVPPTGIRFALTKNVPIINNSYGWANKDVQILYDHEGSRATAIADLPTFPELFHIFEQGGASNNPHTRRINEIRGDILGKDAVMVWATGNDGWNDERGRIWATRIDVEADGTTMSVTHVLDLASVTTSYKFVHNGTEYNFSDFNLPLNQPGIMALAPIYHKDLLGKWVAVAALHQCTDILRNAGRCPAASRPERFIAAFSQGCGRAKHWCITAPGTSINTASNDDREGATGDDNARYTEFNGTSFAAPHVSGALAVLRSRFPAMPMPAVIAIMFKTANKTVGLPGSVRTFTGVDDVYGHGMLDLGAAITVQGRMNLVITGAVDAAGVLAVAGGVPLNTELQLAPGAGAVLRRLSALPVAVSYLGGDYYFDAPLSGITDFTGGEGITLGNAAQDMFPPTRRAGAPEGGVGAMAVLDERSGQIHRAGYAGGDWRLEYTPCTDCAPPTWRIGAAETIEAAHFAQNQQRIGAEWSPLPQWSFFSAMGLGEDGEDETYRQVGARWQGDFMEAELSEIHEDDSLLGNSGAIFGFTPTRTRQAKLGLSGEAAGWQWRGGYTHGWSDTGVDRTGLVSEASNIQHSQWRLEAMSRALLQPNDEFRLAISGLPYVRGRVKIDYYRASNEKYINDFQYTLPTGITAQSLVLSELTDNALILSAGYRFRPLRHEDLVIAVGYETIRRGISHGDYSASFQLRWGY